VERRACSIVGLLLEEPSERFVDDSHSKDRLRRLCLAAAENADPCTLSLLLSKAKECHLLRACLQRKKDSEKDSDAGGVLHALCKSKARYSEVVKTWEVILRWISAAKVKNDEGDDVVLDDLSWFDENGRLPIDYASEKEFRDRLGGVFPADFMWNQLEITSYLFLERDGVISEKEGGSKARIERWEFVDKLCHVAVKMYPDLKAKMENIKREIGVMSRVRFPFIMRILGWSYFDKSGTATNDRAAGHSIGVVMDLCSMSLHEALKCYGARVATFYKAMWARQVGAAIQYLHRHEPVITHGDVHLMNILLSSSFDPNTLGSLHIVSAILCDFDFSCISGTRTRVLEGADRFPRFAEDCEEALSVESMAALDWFMFGMALFSVS
jgi:serine/threonine protein kinase